MLAQLVQAPPDQVCVTLVGVVLFCYVLVLVVDFFMTR